MNATQKTYLINSSFWRLFQSTEIRILCLEVAMMCGFNLLSNFILLNPLLTTQYELDFFKVTLMGLFRICANWSRLAIL